MEYIVSARKYRPLNFDSVVGQRALTTTLKNAVVSGKLAHAYLFCGPRGVGKTTCARIFARSINCLSPTAAGEACGQCESCRSFDEQRSFNIFELDAASNNSVDDIKSLMEQTRIPPQVGRYKVFIIDEVHMLSTQAFNAFLKTLEEPPAHVVFILATTEKHKLLPTIISRCQIYDFERMNVQNTIDHLRMVAEKEGYTFEEEALAVIAEKADGGMRDALSIFDQVASFCQGNITYEKVIEDLNVLDSDNYFQIVDLAVENKAAEIMVILNKVLARGFDAANVSTGLASHIRNVMMAKDEQTLPLLEVGGRQRERYAAQAKKCPPAFLYHALRILNQCDINYRQSSNKRLLVELSLIQVAQITQPDDAVPASGRSPKRLKTLFQHTERKNRQTQAASQVAAAGHAAPEDAKSDVPTQSNFQSRPSAVAAAQRLKFGNLGVTFASIMKKQGENSAENKTASVETTTKSGDDAVFTQELLDVHWLAMCNRMQLNQEMKSLASRMKNIQPLIVDYPHIEALFDNQMLLDLVQPLMKRVLATLRRGLNNQQVTISFRLAEPEEKRHIPTKVEIFDRLKNESTALARMSDKLKLTIA